MSIYLNRALMKISLSALVLLTLLSCDATIHEGDPAIVADFDFARAWKEAVPTTGAIVELDSVYLANVSTKKAKSYITNNQEIYEYHYSYYDYNSPELITLKNPLQNDASIKAIVNDLGDTIINENSSNNEYCNKVIYKLGFTALYTWNLRNETKSVYQHYLVEVNHEPYDLMATMRSTYNSIKYLQTIYPDSLIPFSVFEN